MNDDMDELPPESPESGLLPQAPVGDFSSQSARSAGDVSSHNERVLRQAEAQNRAIIALPNGEYGFLDDDDDAYLSHTYLAGRHGSVLSSATKLIKDPKPGYVYVWAARYNAKGDKVNAKTVANIRSKRYEPVLLDQLDENTDAPVEAFKIAGFSDVVGIVDVLLMAVSPAAQRSLYKWKGAESRRRTNRWQSFHTLQDRIQGATKGRVRTEIEIK